MKNIYRLSETEMVSEASGLGKDPSRCSKLHRDRTSPQLYSGAAERIWRVQLIPKTILHLHSPGSPVKKPYLTLCTACSNAAHEGMVWNGKAKPNLPPPSTLHNPDRLLEKLRTWSTELFTLTDFDYFDLHFQDQIKRMEKTNGTEDRRGMVMEESVKRLDNGTEAGEVNMGGKSVTREVTVATWAGGREVEKKSNCCWQPCVHGTN